MCTIKSLKIQCDYITSHIIIVNIFVNKVRKPICDIVFCDMPF